MSGLHFYACASGKYENYIPAYITSALSAYDMATVEILVQSSDQVERDHCRSLNVIRKYFPDRFKLTDIDRKYIPRYDQKRITKGTEAPAWRWVTKPEMYCDMTYIGDIDILILPVDDLPKIHQEIMDKTGLPYSNMERETKTPRLSGLMAVLTDEYYKAIDWAWVEEIALATGSHEMRKSWPVDDEHLLWQIVSHHFDLTDNKLRPIHGIHMSQRREILGDPHNPKVPHWGLRKREAKFFKEFEKTDAWQELLSTFGRYYRAELKKLIDAISIVEGK